MNGKKHDLQLKICFAAFVHPVRIDVIAEKSRLTGRKKRTIIFEKGTSDLEQISAPGFLKNEIRVAIKEGLPNTSSNCFMLSPLGKGVQ